MDYYENILDAVGRTPLVRLGRIEKGEEHPRPPAGEGGVPESGRLREGQAGREDARGRREGGAAKARRYRCRADERQHGSRSSARGGSQGLSLHLRDAGQDEQGEAGSSALGAEVIVTPTFTGRPELLRCRGEAGARDTGRLQAGPVREPGELSGPLRDDGARGVGADGRITHFVAGMGTCGTITGTGHYLKEKNPRIKIIGADPEGSIFSDPSNVHTYAVEGVGEDFYPGNYDPEVVDEVIQVDDRESFLMTRQLMRRRGRPGSCGMAVVAAVRAARGLPEDAVMVVLLPDTGRNYVSKVFDDVGPRELGGDPGGPEQSLPRLRGGIDEVRHEGHTRRAGPDDRLDDSPDLPDIHLHPGSAGPAQGLRVQPHRQPYPHGPRRVRSLPRRRRVRPRLRLRARRDRRDDEPPLSRDHVVAGDDLYGGTYRLFDKVLARSGGLEFTYADTTDPEAVGEGPQARDEAALDRDAHQPVAHHLGHSKELSEMARERGAVVAVDNTFASPYFQRPLL